MAKHSPTLRVVPAHAGIHTLRVSKGNVRLPTYSRHGVWVPAFAGTTDEMACLLN
jgi:hypothetical protein